MINKMYDLYFLHTLQPEDTAILNIFQIFIFIYY
jgi:hypothetical protein